MSLRCLPLAHDLHCGLQRLHGGVKDPADLSESQVAAASGGEHQRCAVAAPYFSGDERSKELGNETVRGL